MTGCSSPKESVQPNEGEGVKVAGTCVSAILCAHHQPSRALGDFHKVSAFPGCRRQVAGRRGQVFACFACSAGFV